MTTEWGVEAIPRTRDTCSTNSNADRASTRSAAGIGTGPVLVKAGVGRLETLVRVQGLPFRAEISSPFIIDRAIFRRFWQGRIRSQQKGA